MISNRRWTWASDPCAGQGDGSIQDVMRSEPARAALLFCEGGRTIGGLSCNACEQYSPNSENGCAPIPDCVRNEPEFGKHCFFPAPIKTKQFYYNSMWLESPRYLKAIIVDLYLSFQFGGMAVGCTWFTLTVHKLILIR